MRELRPQAAFRSKLFHRMGHARRLPLWIFREAVPRLNPSQLMGEDLVGLQVHRESGEELDDVLHIL